MRVLVCIFVSALLLWAPAAEAGVLGGGSDRDEGPNLWSDLEFKPVVGNWAEYRMTPKDEETMTMRLSIVGEEDDAHWYELVMKDEKGKTMVSKMLVSGDPQETDNIKRMIVKMADQPAMEMPVQMMAMIGDTGEEDVPDVKMTDVGVESVTVPAGTFKASHWQFKSGEDVFDAWVSEGVGPYGVVKSASGEFEMVLTAQGDKAVSLITETPQSMPAIPAMPDMRMPAGE